MATTTQSLTNSPRRSGRWRTATSVAVAAATIATVHAWDTAASSSADEASFVPTAPCRLFDTRPGSDPAGGKKSPLGPGESNVHTQQVTGTVGNCQVPTDAVAVSMNVTAVNGTAQSNLRVFPADVPTPTASNLNWVARRSPTPNKVDVQLSPEGAIKLYNHNGTVDVLADVVGYYTPNALDGMQSRLTDLESRVLAQQTTSNEHASRLGEVESRSSESDQRLDTLEHSAPFTVSASEQSYAQMRNTPVTTLEIDVTAPADGHLAVTHSTSARVQVAGRSLWCSVFKKPFIPSGIAWMNDPGTAIGSADPGESAPYVTLTATKALPVTAGERMTLLLVCQGQQTDFAVGVYGRTMTAVFTPAP